MKQEGSSQSRASGSRHTRSQIGPDWTLKDELILVNEIFAVEGDCQKALSSIQKWKIIADNCTVLDVPRTSNQCRRKWESLLAEYNKIKKWETQSKSKSFWLLEKGKRKEVGLPENFDDELFKAIDDHVRSHDAQSDTEPDSDPEAIAIMTDVVEETGPKKQKRRLMPPKSSKEGKLPKCNSHEKPPQSQGEVKYPKSSHEEKPQKARAEEMPEETLNEDKGIPEKRCSEEEENHPTEEGASVEEKEKRMMWKLRENAEFILATLNEKTRNENTDYRAFGLKSAQEIQMEYVRRKGDAVIAYLGEIVHTLHQLHVNTRGSA